MRGIWNSFFKKAMNMNAHPVSMMDLVLYNNLNKPSIIKALLTENAIRHQIFSETLSFLSVKTNLDKISEHAQKNMSEWKKNKISAPNIVEVIARDWGNTTLEMTRRHGQIYTVLNMASSDFPGGGCFDGGSAQEENMWQRSTCVLSMLGNEEILFNQDDTSYRYSKTLKKLIDGQVLMSESEMNQLRKQVANPLNNHIFKVFWDANPRICFRGAEQYIPVPSDVIIGPRESLHVDSSLKFLNDHEIFPFHEMRSAAPMNDLTNTKMEDELSRRIGAQLDTLILHNQSYVVLGAWGCGQYHQKPEMVSKIYANEIAKRADFFKHIVFAIRSQGLKKSHTFGIFSECLNQLPLNRLNHSCDSKHYRMS